jgi:hypothetical protein
LANCSASPASRLRQWGHWLKLCHPDPECLRHLTLNATGTGRRQLRVSSISEVPVCKSTDRIVFPRAAAGGESSNPIVQGWAVVDNTIGSDWRQGGKPQIPPSSAPQAQ